MFGAFYVLWSHYLPQDCKGFLLFFSSPRNFYSFSFYIWVYDPFEVCFCMVWGKDHVHFIHVNISLSQCHLLKRQKRVNLFQDSVACSFVHPYATYHSILFTCSFIVGLEVRKCVSFNFALLIKIVFGYYKTFIFLTKLYNQLVNFMGISLVGSWLGLCWICFGKNWYFNSWMRHIPSFQSS